MATVALLKARFDEGVDHIDMFMPLVIETISSMPSNSFTVADIQESLQQRHGLAIPQNTLITLLKRATSKGVVRREFSRYVRKGQAQVMPDLQAKTRSIEQEQQRLAQEFRKHAQRNGGQIETDEKALGLILDFLEDNQVAMLLGTEKRTPRQTKLTHQESRLVAEFAQSVLETDPNLARILQNILEGLVVYNTAFLRDITSPTRQFKGLRVFIDTQILIQALGYEGKALASLVRETLQLLKAAGVRCLAFDKTVQEIKGILRVHEDKLGTTQGMKSLYATPMSRFLITNHYAPSDIRQMSALLPNELASLGFQITPMPRHVKQYTLDEKKLGEALADQRTRDMEEPRVIHDVDCVAAILTLRKGERSVSLADAKAVFATSSRKVIENVQRWYDDEGEAGVAPVIHIRALSNLAWLRRPAAAVDLKAHELVALCHAALRPSRKTWEHFLQHLNNLERNHSLTSDEAVAVVVSEMTDELLGDIDDDDILDASTLDEVVERVRSTYEAEASKRVAEYEAEATKRIAEHETEAKHRLAEVGKQVSEQENQVTQQIAQATLRVSEVEKDVHAKTEAYRRLKLAIEGKASSLAHLMARTTFQLVGILVICGALVLIIGHPIQGGLWGTLIALPVIVFVLMEFLGILHHMTQLSSGLEARLLPRLRRALGAEDTSHHRLASILGLDSTPDEEG
ncbi:MAG TPA: hypothetical protein VHE60_14790 [Pyrinomonadaceae bacterium]|nr:hypothetical protein [Pyrinomonadaceae bacterium]